MPVDLKYSKENKYDWEVYVQPFEDIFQLISIKNINGEMAYQKLNEYSYKELSEFADDEEYDEDDYCEDDEDIEFDGVAEYDEDGNLITQLFKEEDFTNVGLDENGNPEIEVEFHVELPSEEDDLDDKTDYYQP